MIQQIQSKRRSIILSGLAVLALIALGGVRLGQLHNDPQVSFLSAEAGAQWIKLDTVFNLYAREAGLTVIAFRRRFETTATIPNAWLTVRAMKQCRVILDGKLLYTSPDNFDTWKQPHRIRIPSPVEPRTHELIVLVRSRNSPPAMLAYSDELGVRTGPDWEASINGRDWTPAWPVSRAKPATISREFPSAPRALLNVSPWLLPVFVIVFAWSMLNGHSTAPPPRFEPWRPKPHHIRWALLFLWSVLAVNNIFKIPHYIGMDVEGHLKYIQYVAENRSLPLATDGWQMGQAPLYYIVNMPLYVLFANSFAPETLVKLLRIIPLICGLVQIEIVYRSARLVFPDKDDLQAIAIIIGGLMPMHIYISQVIGNEPLAGILTSLVILLSLSLLTDQPKKHRYLFFVVMGVVWGLAVLSKVTAILLAPPMVMAIAVYGRSIGESAKRVLIKAALVFGTCFATAGWFFIRNWIELGELLPYGNVGIEWWQEPGYRTWSQLLSFGKSLTYPVYSGVMSFWDALYSTMWLDGLLSGRVIYDSRPPWNDHFMLAGAWLALIPTLFLFAGIAAPLCKAMRQSRKAILFSLACIAIYIGAILDHSVQLPYLGSIKATYTLGLLPCYGLVIAAGAKPFLRVRFVRALIMASIACWGIFAFLAYFVMTAENDLAHLNQGIALAEQGKIEEAIGHFNQALKIKPDDALAHGNLGIALATQGKLKEAIGHFNEALRIRPDDAVIHNNLGIALIQLGKIEEAIGHFNQALKIKPDDEAARENLRRALLQQGK